jgi:hypothetical protein
MERHFLARRLRACEGGDLPPTAFYEELWNRQLVALEDYLDGEDRS